MKNGAISLSILMFACAPSAVIAETRAPNPTSLALQSIQTRDFEEDQHAVFSAIISVLQDYGYTIKSADFATGLINASGLPQIKRFGLVSSKQKTPIVSVFVEQIGKLTKVRISFLIDKGISYGMGIQSRGEEVVTDPQVYQDAFEKIDKALFLRKNAN